MIIQCVRCRKIKNRKGWEYKKPRSAKKVKVLETLCPHCARFVYKTGFDSRTA